MGYHLRNEAAAEPRGEAHETGRVLTGFESVGSGYRYYSSELGRWISRDPLDEEGGKNLFALVANDPLNRIDFLGLLPDRWFWGRTSTTLCSVMKENPRIVIFGATGGIGSALARQLALQGCRLTLAARDPSRLAILAGELQADICPIEATASDAVDGGLSTVQPRTGSVS